MKPAVVIQARVGSTRLPNKALLPLAGRPLVSHVIGRCLRFPEIRSRRDVVLAVPDTSENDPLAELGDRERVAVFRGDEEDVLLRTILAAESVGADVIYRATGDNALVDPGIVSETWRAFSDGEWDYAVMEDTPLGTTAEVVAVEALRRASAVAVSPRQREHPTLAMYENAMLFRMRLIQAPPQWHRPELRLTIDTEDDLKLVSVIVETLGEKAGVDEIIAFLDERPEVAVINRSVEQRSWDELKRMKEGIRGRRF